MTAMLERPEAQIDLDPAKLSARKDRTTKSNYTVKSVETVLAGSDVQARIFTLAPGEVIPWHHHSETTDHFFVLSGKLTIGKRAPHERRSLAVGERYQVAPRHAHEISNNESIDCQFLLLQGVGKYDWIKSES
jgi:quercetin dioxygenase-like cupin family protein